MTTLLRAATVALAGFGFAAALHAQSPAVDPRNAELAREQQAQQKSQPLNNEPVWREIRSGIPQTTSLPGRETNILIQPQGQTWRALRNGQVSVYGGWLLVVVFLAICAFYWRKGTIPLHGAPTGRTIPRFTAVERMIHWTTAITFVTLALTGLVVTFGKNILLPLIGYTLFSWLATLSKTLHNFVGPLFSVCVILIFVTFVRSNLPQKGDGEWFRKAGGLFSGEHVPSHRFNGGEKMWFWGGVFLLGLVVSVSGLILNFPNFDQTRQTMQIANIVHLVAGLLFMAAALGHIYMGTLGVAGAFDAMRTGYVDETWAREHHAYWYDDMVARGRKAAAEPRPVPAIDPDATVIHRGAD